MAKENSNIELTQEVINNFAEKYNNIVSDSLSIAEKIDEKNPELNLSDKLTKIMDNNDGFMDSCELISSYDVDDNKFTNEDLYKYIFEISEESKEK